MSLFSNNPGKSCNAEQKQYWHHAPVWVSVSIVVTEKVVLPNLEIKELKWRQNLWDLCSPFCHELSWEVGQHLKEGLHTILVPKIKCHRSACIALKISYTNMPIITLRQLLSYKDTPNNIFSDFGSWNTQTYAEHLLCFREVIKKKNCDETVRLTDCSFWLFYNFQALSTAGKGY